MKTPARTLILLAGLIAPIACGQQVPQPGSTPIAPAPMPQAPQAPAAVPPPGVPQPLKTQVFQNPPENTPKFEPLGKKGPDGKIIQIDGVVDAHALLHNPLVDAATRERIRAAVEDWAADVNQLAIDNLDFLERIDEGGLIDKLDFNNNDQLRFISQVMVPFISAGSLTTRLQNKAALTGEQCSLNSTITNDYFQARFNEVMADQGGLDPIRMSDSPETQQQKIDKVNKLTHFLYYMTCNDARQSYHRLMIESAPMAEQVVGDMGLAGADLSKVQAELPAVKKSSTEAQKLEAVRAMLKPLTFDQRRAYLQKAMNRGCNKNPIDAIGPANTKS